MRLPRLCCLAASVGVAVLARGASFEDRVEALFRPAMGELMALSPDGQRVAYTTLSGRDLSIVMLNVDDPGQKRTVKVEPERAEGVVEDLNRTPVQLRFLKWATPNRLIFAPTPRVVPLPPIADKSGRLHPNPDGPTVVSPILATDADGKQRGVIVDAKNFQETPADARKSLADMLRTTKELQSTRNEAVRWRMPHLDILGFMPKDREQLIIGTRGAYSMPMQHLVDVRTGSIREFGTEWPAAPGAPAVFDWFRLRTVGEQREAAKPTTAWRDDELAGVQRELERKFPRRAVEILDWSETRARLLVRVTGGTDAGRIFVYQRPEDIPVEILRRAPWLTAAKLHETRFFEFAAADGARLSGYLTWPSKPRVAPAPLLIVFPEGFPGRAQPAWDPEAQVFADWGFAVARLNHRGVAGVRKEDLTGLRAAVDRVSVDDARAVIAWLAARSPQRPIDERKVVTLGRGFGGYLAVRALQLRPEAFRCAFAIDAPMELRTWLQPPVVAFGAASPAPAREIPAALIDHPEADWKNLSVVEQAEALTHPVMTLCHPGHSAVVDLSTRELRSRLQRAGRAPEHVELDVGFAAARPESRVAVYRKMEEFLNTHVHGYAVKIGPVKEVE